MILDEPTSGLDSITAESVIQLLHEQAQSGKMIIFTIHQPSSRIYKIFDRLILMSEGTVLYQGVASQSVKYLENLGFKCPQDTNPPDFYMRLLYVSNRNNMVKKEQELLKKLSESYRLNANDYGYYKGNEKLSMIEIYKNLQSAAFIEQFRVIFERAMLNVLRQPMLSMMKVVQGLFMSIVIILIYHGNSGDYKSMQNYQGILFFNVFDSFAMSFQSQILTFPLERSVFIKEYKEDLYGVNSYFSAKLISEIPFQIIFSIIYCTIIYFVIPYNTESASKFFIFFGISFLAQISGNVMGYMIGSFTSSMIFSITFGPTLLIIFVIFGGFFSNTSSLSSAFSWVKYISPINYTYRAFIINQFTDFSFDKGVLNPIDTLNFQGTVWGNAGSLLLVILGFFLIAIIGLKLSGEGNKKKHA